MPYRTVAFRKAVEMLHEPVWVIDPDSRVAYFNSAALHLLGYSADDVVGRPVFDFFFPADREEMSDRMVRRRQGAIERYQMALRRADGTAVWGQLSARPSYDDAGQFTGSVAVITDISSLKAAEAALRQSEHRYRLIADNVVDVVWTLDPRTLTLNYISPSVERLLGWSPDQLVGQPASLVLQPKDLPTVRELVGTLLSAPQWAQVTRTRQFDQPHKDGHLVPTEVVTTIITDDRGGVTEILGVSRDNSARRSAEDALRQSEAWLRHSQRLARLGSYVFDVSRDSWTSSAELDDLFGIGPDFARTADGWLALVHPDDRDRMERHLIGDVVGRGRPFNAEYRVVRKSTGDELWVHGRGELEFDESGRPARMFGTIQDITERRLQEDGRRELEARLLQAQKLESLGVLAGGVAHEFNNLLTSILGNADLALQDLAERSPVRDNIQAIETASRRAAEISQQLLAYSGRGRFVVGPVDLSATIGDIKRVLELAVSKKTALKLDTPAGLPQVEADADQVRQMLLNLITNASEAIGDRGGVVHVSVSTIESPAPGEMSDHLGNPIPPGRYVALEVTDSGPGMDAATRDRVFDPFFSTKFTGRGLGLPAVLGIVRGHAGFIQVESAPGEGTMVRVLLAAIPAAAGQEPVPQTVAADPPSAGTILVVDDEEGVRTLAMKMVERCGYRSAGAADGLEAIRIVSESPERFRCVLLDLTMPNLGGEDTLVELRKIAPGLPVVLCSGYQAQDLRERFADQGLAGFIQKPYRLADLRARLESLPG